MKQRYMIGAGILLLAIIATGFGVNEMRKLDAQDGVAAQPASSVNEALATTTGNNTQSGPGAESSTGTEAITTTGSTHRRYVKHSASAAGVDDSYEYNSLPGDPYIAAGIANTNKEIRVEKSKTYYANVADQSAVLSAKKHHHLRFRLPENTGIEIGYNQSGLVNSPSGNIPVGSVNVGLLYNLSMGDDFAFQPGIRYLTKGNSLQSELDVNNKEKLSLHYLEVPANLVWKIGKIGNTRIMVGAGPYVSYLVAAKDKYQASPFSDGGGAEPSTQQYATNNVNKFDWGMGGFLGVQSPDGFFIKAGGEYGMKDLMKNSTGANANRNYSMLLTVGFIMGNKL